MLSGDYKQNKWLGKKNVCETCDEIYLTVHLPLILSLWKKLMNWFCFQKTKNNIKITDFKINKHLIKYARTHTHSFYNLSVLIIMILWLTWPLDCEHVQGATMLLLVTVNNHKLLCLFLGPQMELHWAARGVYWSVERANGEEFQPSHHGRSVPLWLQESHQSYRAADKGLACFICWWSSMVFCDCLFMQCV